MSKLQWTIIAALALAVCVELAMIAAVAFAIIQPGTRVAAATVINSPANGGTYSADDPVSIESLSTDPNGISQVDILIDGVVVRSYSLPSAASCIRGFSHLATGRRRTQHFDPCAQSKQPGCEHGRRLDCGACPIDTHGDTHFFAHGDARYRCTADANVDACHRSFRHANSLAGSASRGVLLERLGISARCDRTRRDAADRQPDL